jgi:hypothetical protein
MRKAMGRICAVILHAPSGRSPGERLVEQSRKASARDLVETLVRAGVKRIHIVTPDEEFGRDLATRGVLARASAEPFHFGRTLQELIAEQEIDGLLYFGSGSGVLLSESNVRDLVTFAEKRGRRALFNNFYSCDFAAIAEAQGLREVALPAIDNSLGFALANAGYACFVLPRDAATQVDIDTPTDLVLLATAEQGGEELRAFLEQQELSHPAIGPLLERLVDRRAHLYLIGRVNPLTWAHFEKEVACRTSGLVEGRGLRAYPDRPGTVLGKVIEDIGPASFFRRLAHLADGAIIDTRALLAQGGTLPPASDRFSSDLLRPELVKDSSWAEFTAAAIEAPIPVLLGGHSLVSGGLYLLAGTCWKGKDLPLRLHPNSIAWTKERP